MHIPPLDEYGPRYRQLYRALRAAILAGRARPGARLPSTRWLASETGVARNRVVLAYAQLVDEGYAVGRTGSGTYVAPELPASERPLPVRLAEEAPLGRPRLSGAGRRLVARGAAWMATRPRLRWDFACGRPSWRDFPHAVWARLLRRHARWADGGALDYAPAAGVPQLRAAIAAHLAQWRGVACDAEQVIVTNGSQQALGLVASLLVEPGGTVGIEEPHYAGARQALEAARVRLLPLRVDPHGLDVGRLASCASRPRVVYVTPAHQFPTGAVLPLARRLALLAWARRHDAYVVEDDYDSEYRYGGAPIESLHGLDRGHRVFYVGSFSKILAPSLRLGYLVVPRPLVRAVTVAKNALDLGCATFLQRVLADFITDGHFEVHLRRARRRHASRRQALLAALDAHLGGRVAVHGGDAGLHVMLVPPQPATDVVERIVRSAAARSVGIYSTTALYLRRPRRSALLLGHGSLSEAEIAAGIACFADAVTDR